MKSDSNVCKPDNDESSLEIRYSLSELNDEEPAFELTEMETQQ